MGRVLAAALAALLILSATAEAASLEKTRLRTTKKSTLQGVMVTQAADKDGDVVVVCEFFGEAGKREFAKVTVRKLGKGEKDVAELRVPGAWTSTKCAALDADRVLAAERAALEETLRRLIKEASGE